MRFVLTHNARVDTRTHALTPFNVHEKRTHVSCMRFTLAPSARELLFMPKIFAYSLYIKS